MPTFAERLAELDARKLAERPTSPITPGDLPTEYGQLSTPQGVMRDADTFTRPSGEVFRGYGVNAAELQDKKTGQLIPEGQEAYARSAQLFAQNPNTKPIRYGQDKYGRTVADEITPEGRSVYGQMVERGVAPSTNYNKAPVAPFGAESRRRYNRLSEPDYRERAIAAYQGRAPQVDIPEPVVFDLKNRTAGEALKSSVARGLEGMMAGAYGTVSAVGDLLANNEGAREPRNLPEDQLTLRDRITNWLQRTGEAGYMEHDAKARAIPKVGTLEDAWEGKVNALQWGLETLGEAVPSTLAMLGTAVATSGIGTVAGLAARGVGTAALGNLAARAGVAGAAEATGAGMLRGLAIKQAEKTLAAQAVKRLGAAGVNASPGEIYAAAHRVATNPEAWLRRMYAGRAALPGAWLGSTTLEAGHIYEDTKQAYGPEQVSPGLSLAGGAVAGLLDTAALHYAVAPLAKLLGGATEEAATGAAKSLVGEVAKRVLGGMGTEGATEAMQEIVAVATQELQNPDQSVPLLDRLTTPENRTRYLEAGVAGMIFGGVFAAPGGAASYLSQPRQPTATPEAGPPVSEPTSDTPPPPESPPAFGPSPLPPTVGAPGATTAPNVAGTVPPLDISSLKSTIEAASRGINSIGDFANRLSASIKDSSGVNIPSKVFSTIINRNFTSLEDAANSASSNPEFVSNLLYAVAAHPEFVGSVEIPAYASNSGRVVKAGMFGGADNQKIIGQVIKSIPVDMVNMFGGEQRPTNEVLNGSTVGELTSAVNPNTSILSDSVGPSHEILRDNLGQTERSISNRTGQVAPGAPTAPTAPTTPFDIDDAAVRTETINRLTPKEIEDLAEHKVFSNVVNGVPQGPRQGWGDKPGWLNNQQWDAFKRLNIRHLAAAWNATIREPIPGAAPDPQTGRIKHRDTGIPLLSDALKAELSKIIRPSLLQSLDALGARFFSGVESRDVHASGFARALVGEKKAKGAGNIRGTRWGEEWPTQQRLAEVLAQLPTATPAAPTPAATNKLGVVRIISGGQTGGDLGGLKAAKALGVETGGTIPKGWRTDEGARPEYGAEFGLKEHSSDNYVPRTIQNVNDAEATIAFVWGPSVGTSKTIGFAQTGKWQNGALQTKLDGHRPVLVITSRDPHQAAREIWNFVKQTGVKTLNIAGHREKSQPGIEQFVNTALTAALTEQAPAAPTPATAEPEREYLDQNGYPYRAPTLEPVTAPTPTVPTRKVANQKWITRNDLKANPKTIYLFGDNLRRVGFGGQAKEMRGEPNAIGVPTKKAPTMEPSAFMTDAEYDQNIKAIDEAFAKIPATASVVLPEDGLGTGLAKLDTSAPKTFAYLQKKLAELGAAPTPAAPAPAAPAPAAPTPAAPTPAAPTPAAPTPAAPTPAAPQRVYTRAEVSRGHAKAKAFVNDLTRLLGLPDLMVTSALTDAMKAQGVSEAGAAALDPAGPTPALWINPDYLEIISERAGPDDLKLKANQTVIYTTIGHEVGHWLHTKAWEEASPEVKNAVDAAYAAWHKAQAGRDPADIQTSSRVVQLREPAKMSDKTKARLMRVDEGQTEPYILSKREWLADQIAGVLVNDPQVLTFLEKQQPLVRRWINRLVARFKQLYQRIQALTQGKGSLLRARTPNAAVARFVMEAAERNRHRWAETQGWFPEVTATLQRLLYAVGEKDFTEQVRAARDLMNASVVSLDAWAVYDRWAKALEQADAAARKLPDEVTRTKLVSQIIAQGRLALDQQYPWFSPRRHTELAKFSQLTAQQLKAAWGVQAPELANALTDLIGAATIAKTFGTAVGYQQGLQLERQQLGPKAKQELNDLLGALPGLTDSRRAWMRELSRLFEEVDDFATIKTQFLEYVADNPGPPATAKDRIDNAQKLMDLDKFRKGWEQWRKLRQKDPITLDGNDGRWLYGWRTVFGLEEVPVVPEAMDMDGGGIVTPFANLIDQDEFRGAYDWMDAGLYYDGPDTLPNAFARYLVNNGLFSKLDAKYRDALVAAIEQSAPAGTSPASWLSGEVAKALRTNPVILRAMVDQARFALDNQALFNEALISAIVAKPTERANPTVNAALERLLADQLGGGYVTKLRTAVGLSGVTSEFLPVLQMRALGADGKYTVVKHVLTALARVDDRQNLEAVMQELVVDPDVAPEDLRTARLAYQDLLGERVSSEQFLRTLVNLYEALQRKESNELTVEDLVNERRSQEADQERYEEMVPLSDEDGGLLEAIPEESDFVDTNVVDALRYDDDLETQERPDTLSHALALRSTVFETAGKNTRDRQGQVYSRVEAIPLGDELDSGSLLNAGGTRSLDLKGARMGERFDASYGNPLFEALPAAMQHVLMTRTLMLNQAGLDVKFELAQHRIPDGRQIVYVKETAKPGPDADLVRMEGGLSRATLDSLATLVEERRRSTSRMAESSKRNSGVVFSTGANLKHPLIQRMVGAMEQALASAKQTVDDWRGLDFTDPATRHKLQGLVLEVDKALEDDPLIGGKRRLTEGAKDFGRSLLAAMGFDNAVFFEGKVQFRNDQGFLENLDDLIDPKLDKKKSPAQRAKDKARYESLVKDPSRLETQGRGMVIINKTLAEQMGIPLYTYQKPRTKRTVTENYHAIKVDNFGGIIDLFVRAYLKYHENDASHLTTGASAELTLDDVVKVGYTAMRGLDAVSGTHMDRIAALVKGFEVLRTKLAHSLRPMPTETHTQLVDKKDAKNQPVYLKNLDGSIRKDKDDKPVPAKMWKYQTTDGIKTDLSLVDFDNLPENSPLRGWILKYDPKTREFVTVGDVLEVKSSIKGLIKEIATLQNEAAALTEDLSELERQFQKTVRRRQEASDREAMGFPAKEDDVFLLNNPDVLARFVGKLRNVFLNRNAKLRLARSKITEVREVYQDRTLRDDNALNDSEAVLDLLERAGIKDPAWDRSAADDQRLYGEEWRQIEYRVQKTSKELGRLSGEEPSATLRTMPGEGKLEGSEVAARPPEVKPEPKTVTPEQRAEASKAKVEAERHYQDWLDNNPILSESEWFKVKQKPLPTAQPVSANEFTAEQTTELRGEFNWMMSELGIPTAVLQHIDLLRMARERGETPTFRQLLDELALTEQADEIVAMAQNDPYFTVYKDDVPHVYLITQGEDYDTVRGKLAHEMGHVFYRTNLSDLKKATGGKQAAVWKQLVKEATGGQPRIALISDDLMVDEYVASRMQRILLGLDKPVEVKGPPMVRKFIDYLLGRLQAFYDKLFGKTGRAKTKDSKQFVDNFLSGVLATIQYRNAVMQQNGVLSDLKEGMETLLNATPDYSPGIRYYAGQKLLESTRAGKFIADRARGVWRHARSLHHHITKTLDARLRSELDPNGKPLAALTALADLIVRAPGAAAPAPYTYRDMTIDFARQSRYFEGFRPAWLRQAAGKALWVNEAFDNLTDSQKQDLMRRYVVARDTNQLATAPVEVKNLAKLFERLKDYYKDVLNSHVGSQSTELPRIWNKDALTANKQDFLDMLTIKYAWKPAEAEEVYNHLLTEVSLYRGEDYSFYAPHLALARLNSDLASVNDIDLLPFLRVTTEPEATMKEYATQLIKRVEFERRFAAWVVIPTNGSVDYSLQGSVPALHDPAKHGNLYWDSNENSWMSQKGTDKFKVRWDQTVKLRILYNAALAEGATPSQLRFMIKAMDAVLGRAGADFDPNLRRLSSLIVTGMNWALLPLAVTTNLAGLAVPAIRANGAMGASWRGLTTALGEMRKEGELYQIATANGVVMDNLRGLYGRAYLDTPFMDQTFRKLNDTFFRYNGMEWLDNLTRLTAFATGIEWFKGLAVKPGAESDALLKQFGLTHAVLTKWLDPNGLNGKLTAPPPNPAHTPQQKAEQKAQETTAYKIQVALNQFVAESAMHPDATQRPLWASHPAAMVVWHLKSFLWSYGHVVMGRMLREYQRADSYGKKVLILALPWALMVPLAMLGTVVREEIRDGLWGKPARREKEPEDYAMDILSRTGLLGPLQLALDANRSAGYGTPVYTALLGPFATSMDQMIRKIGGAGEGRLAQETTDAILRISPIIGALPDTRRALLEQMFR